MMDDYYDYYNGGDDMGMDTMPAPQPQQQQQPGNNGGFFSNLNPMQLAGILAVTGVPLDKAIMQGASMQQQRQQQEMQNYKMQMMQQKYMQQQSQIMNRENAFNDLLGEQPQQGMPQGQQPMMQPGMEPMQDNPADTLGALNAMPAPQQGMGQPAPNPMAPQAAPQQPMRAQLSQEDKEQARKLWAIGNKQGVYAIINKNQLNSKDTFDMENKLRDEFIAQSKPWHEINSAYTRIKASAKDPTAAGDIALIYNYMKMLDPGSVVREGEFATAANAGGIPERIRSQWNKLQTGERLSDDIRNDFVDRSGRLYADQKKDQRILEKRYDKIARTTRLNPENVIIKYEDEMADQGQQQPQQQQMGNPSMEQPQGNKDISSLSDEELMAIAQGG